MTAVVETKQLMLQHPVFQTGCSTGLGPLAAVGVVFHGSRLGVHLKALALTTPSTVT